MVILFVVALVLSIVITTFIFKLIYRNSYGTTGAYAKRFFVIWFIVAMAMTKLVMMATGVD